MARDNSSSGSVMSGLMWMLFLGIVIGWIPILGNLIAGFVGGRKAGGVGRAFAAALLPGVFLAIILAVIVESLAGGLVGAIVPGFAGWVAAGGMVLYVAYSGPLLIGALIGGATAPQPPEWEDSPPYRARDDWERRQYLEEQAGPQASPAPRRSSTPMPYMPPVEPAVARSQSAPGVHRPATRPDGLLLQVLRGEGQGGAYRLTPYGPREAFLVGRTGSEGVQVGLPSQAVSRQHALLLYDGGSWALRHLSGTNPTRLNGRNLEEARPTPLDNGDRLTIGDLELEVRLNA